MTDFDALSDHLARLRRDQVSRELSEGDMAPDPMTQFGLWVAEAIDSGIEIPNQMTVATSESGGVPSARTVLLKGFDERGFVFYTNYESRKARELDVNPHAALVLHWSSVGRQVSAQGPVTKVSRDEAAAYWATRPQMSKLAAWASRQSEVIETRGELDARINELAQRFGDDVPLPDFWGGFRIAPESVEFWQSRPNRMHDRLRYRRLSEGWLLERLSP